MDKFILLCGLMIFGLINIVIIGIVLSIPIYFLWNWLMPTIFGLKTITIFQAWGLLIISGMLFKSNISTEKKD